MAKLTESLDLVQTDSQCVIEHGLRVVWSKL